MFRAERWGGLAARRIVCDQGHADGRVAQTILFATRGGSEAIWPWSAGRSVAKTRCAFMLHRGPHRPFCNTAGASIDRIARRGCGTVLK